MSWLFRYPNLAVNIYADGMNVERIVPVFARPLMLLLLNSCHKAIPTTVERLDAALRLSTITNDFPHRHQTRIQGSIGDELLGPQMLKELIFGDDTLAMANQVVQYLKDFRSQLDGFATAGKLITLSIEDIAVKHIAHA